MNKVEIEISGRNTGAVTAINGVKKEVIDLERVTGGFSNRLGGLGSLLKNSFSTVAVAGFATAVGYAIKRQIDFADEVYKASQKIGFQTDTFSTLKYAADLSDVSFDQLTNTLGKLNRNMFDAARGNKEAKLGFDSIGVSVSDADKKLRDSDVVLLEVAEKISNLKDGAAKTAIVMKLFGRSGADLIPLLNQGADGIQRLQEEARSLGLEISENTGIEAEKFNDSLTTLKATAEGLAIQVLPPLLSALNDIAEGIKNMHLGENIPKMIEYYKLLNPAYNVSHSQDVIDSQTLQNKLLKQGYIDATTYKKVLEETVKPLHDQRSELEKIVDSQNIFGTDIKIVNEEVNKLGKEWSSITLKLKNDITMAGLNPMNQLIFKHVEEAEKLLQKYQGIAGATALIREHLLVGLTSEIFKEPKPMRQTEIGTPGDLVPGFNMEQIQFLHDQQIALASDVTDQELAMYALREGAFTDMLGNMAGAMNTFTNISGNTNKTLFAFYKAFAIGEAGVATYLAATKALAEVPFPFNFAAAAAVTVAGLANIARIASMQPGSSGGGGILASGASMPFMSNIQNNSTSNYGGNKQYTINIYGFVGTDKDAIARDLIPALEKAWEDGVGHG